MHLSVARPPQGRVGPSTGTVSLGIPPRSEICIGTHHASGQLAECRTQNIASFDAQRTRPLQNGGCSDSNWLDWSVVAAPRHKRIITLNLVAIAHC